MIDCYDSYFDPIVNPVVNTMCWVMSYWTSPTEKPTDTRDHQSGQRNNHCMVGKSNALWEMSWTTRSCNKDESWLIIVIRRSKANSRTQHKFARGYNRKMMENVDKPLWSVWCWAIPAGQTLSRRMLHAPAFSLLVLHFGQVLTALTSLSELLPLCMCQETRHP